MWRRRRVVQTLRSPDDPVDPRVDAVELRLDLYPDADVEAVLRLCDKPVVVCVRRVADGGRWGRGEEGRRTLLARAADAAFVDVELDASPDLAPPGPRRVVSVHDLRGVPEDLDALFERCLLRDPAVVKIAATPGSAAEAFRLLDLPTAGLGMGSFGTFTRVLAPWTYCAREALAPGMPHPDDLFDVFGVRRLGPAPDLYGVAGDPIEHSRSPHLWNPAFARDGLDAVYLRFRVADLAAFWPAFVAHRGRALSVTAPLKEQAAALARAPAPEVRECGAANLLAADGRAFNTDARAFLDLLPPGRGPALVMGAGGAARAAVWALRRRGYEPRVWNRTRERAGVLGAPVADRVAPAPVVVNTTPLDPPPGPLVLDLRYGAGIDPPASGVGGLAFLEAQARHQYDLLFGRGMEAPQP